MGFRRVPGAMGIGGLALVLLIGGGCYNYAAVGMDALAPGVDVRANLSTEKTLELEEQLGDRRTVLEGRVLEAQGGSVLLAVPWTYRDPRMGQSTLRQRIQLKEPDVLQLELRTVDRMRTGGFLAVLGAGVTFLLVQLLGGDDAGGTIRPGPPNGEV